MTKREAIAGRALALVGCGYVYGATGWICTRARLEQQARQYPLHALMILRYGPKWIGRRCFDCAQLTREAASAAGMRLPSGSSSQWRDAQAWKARGTIDTLPDEPGLFLFTQTLGRMTHTGVSVGGGWEVDARGHAYGVVQRRIEDTSFTHWARLAVDYDADADAPNPPPAPGQRTLRRGMRGEDVRALQSRLLELGFDVGKDGADGVFGRGTRSAVMEFQKGAALVVDGVVGPMTWSALGTLKHA